MIAVKIILTYELVFYNIKKNRLQSKNINNTKLIAKWHFVDDVKKQAVESCKKTLEDL